MLRDDKIDRYKKKICKYFLFKRLSRTPHSAQSFIFCFRAEEGFAFAPLISVYWHFKRKKDLHSHRSFLHLEILTNNDNVNNDN